jgi:CRISPR-associated protein Cmr3
MSRTETWHLHPHDPLVFGTGRRLPATLPRAAHLVPLPGTLAGAVRARFAGGVDDLGAAAARGLLADVSLRGPWLQRGEETLVHAPLHLRTYEAGDTRRVVAGRPVEPRADEGVLPLEGTPPSLLGLTWRLPAEVHKARPLHEHLPLAAVCDLLLSETSALPTKADPPVTFEGRVHVTIDPLAQTAEPSALYSSSGARYADDVAIAVEVTAPEHRHTERAFVLGGEARVVSRAEGTAFPSFEAFRERYASRVRGDTRTPGLLLMLVTPASFSTRPTDHGPGWLPPWMTAGLAAIPGLPSVKAELVAFASERFIPISGWSMADRKGQSAQGRQRPVRRLVPAGTVYYLRLEGPPGAWLDACARFWGAAIDTDTPGDDEALLAAPHRDGYGMVLPGLWWPGGGESA